MPLLVRLSNQVRSVSRYPCSCAVAVGMSLCVDVIVKSSAYDIMFVGGCGGECRACRC